MRRVGSVILFVIGGWLLSTEVMMSWASFGPDLGVAAKLIMAGVYLVLAAPFLLGATWASPGIRRRELGLSVMIAAAVGTLLGGALFMIMADPAVAKMMPPGQSAPQIGLDLPFGALNLVLVTALGYFLWRSGTERAGGGDAGLEQVFD
jgi:hypothetical protein